MPNGQPQFIDPISDVDPITGLTNDPRNVNIPKVSGSSFYDPIPGQVAGAPTDVGQYIDRESKYDEDITLRDLQTGRLEEERAYAQPTSDKWTNGLVKFVGKTGTAVLGGTVGAIAGIPAAISQGEFAGVFDNDVQKMLDSWNEGLDAALPNH